MDKKTEALKLALEALEVATTPLARDRQEVLRAITALREALAEQPAQPSKPWVGLTRDERMDIINRFAGQDWVYAVEAIEAKLREKNA